MKRFFIISFLYLFCNSPVKAQQLPLFTQYNDSWSVLNPASLYSGYLLNEQNIAIGITHRQQWNASDIKGTPKTSIIHAQFIPSNSYLNFFTGGYLISDQTGAIGTTGLYGNFAYKLRLGSRRNQQYLSIGVTGGLVQYRVNFSDEILNFFQDEINVVNSTSLYPDFGLGLFYHFEDKIYGGISMPQIFGLNTVRDISSTPGKQLTISKVRHYYAFLGGFFDMQNLPDESALWEPSLWVRYTPNAPLNWDFNLKIQPSNFFWVGGGIGTGLLVQAAKEENYNQKLILHTEAGFIFYESKMKIAFSFDWPLSEYLNGFGNTFELHAIYSWEP